MSKHVKYRWTEPPSPTRRISKPEIFELHPPLALGLRSHAEVRAGEVVVIAALNRKTGEPILDYMPCGCRA